MSETLIKTEKELKEQRGMLKDLQYRSRYNFFHENKLDLEDKETNQKKVIKDLEEKLPKRIEGFHVKTKSSGKHRKRKITKKRKHKKSKTKKRKIKNKRKTKKR